VIADSEPGGSTERTSFGVLRIQPRPTHDLAPVEVVVGVEVVSSGATVNVFTPNSLPAKSFSTYWLIPLHDRHHADEEHHADGHTDQREEALELLHANGVWGKTNGFMNGMQLLHYS
jgi:hypothetical protein